MDNIRVTALSEKLRSGAISPVKLVEQLLAKAEKSNLSHNAFITLCKSKALEQAQKIEDELNHGIVRGFFAGIPVAVKDNIHLKDVKITYGSKLFAERIAGITATALAKLEQAGAVVVGKTNLTEFSLGWRDDDPPFGTVTLDDGKPVYGSNNGSAAAVALGLSSVAVGTDSDGFSPATAVMAGVVSLKPSSGRVSRHGVFPVSSSLDSVCFFGSGVEDLAAVLEAAAGFDVLDESSVYADVPSYISYMSRKKEGLKIGLIRFPDSFVEVDGLMDLLDGCGFSAFEVDVAFDDLENLWTEIGLAEAAAFHDEFFPEWKQHYSPNARRLLITGSKISAVDYIKALKRRNEIKSRFEKLFEQFDLLATVFQVGSGDENVDASFGMPLLLLGHPSVTLPLTDNHRAGLVLVGKFFEEPLLLSASYIIQRSRE